MKATLLKKIENPALTVAKARDRFLEHKRQDDRKGSTVESYLWSITALVPDGEMMLEALGDPRVCQRLYDQLRARMKLRAGKGKLAAASHRNALIQTRSFVRWCCEFPQNYLKRNGFEAVRGIGKRKKGKGKLSIDETRRFLIACITHANAGDQGAVAAMMTLLYGMRGTEVAERRVRDFDNDFRLIRIWEQVDLDQGVKTEASERDVEVIPFMRPYFRALALGKPARAWIWDPVRNGSGQATGKVLAALAAARGAPRDAAELAEATGVGLEVVRTILYRLVKDKAVERVGRGEFRSPAAEEGARALEVRRAQAADWKPRRTWVLKSVKRMCREAGIEMKVTAHSMRGLQATLASIGGLGRVLQQVAQHLGHTSTGVTIDHYIEPAALAGEQQAAALRTLIGKGDEGRHGPHGNPNTGIALLPPIAQETTFESGTASEPSRTEPPGRRSAS